MGKGKWRFLACKHCCAGRVLIWSSTGFWYAHETIKAYYLGLGLKVGTNLDWTGNLADYDLIIWYIAAAPEPSWWSKIVDGTWTGRILLTAEWWMEENPFFEASLTFVNSHSGMTGITVTGDVLDCAGEDGWPGIVEANPLMEGVPMVYYDCTSTVSGGATLCRTVTGNHPFIARNFVPNDSGGIDFIVCGDSNPFIDQIGNLSLNEPFWKNLYDVALDA